MTVDDIVKGLLILKKKTGIIGSYKEYERFMDYSVHGSAEKYRIYQKHMKSKEVATDYLNKIHKDFVKYAEDKNTQ